MEVCPKGKVPLDCVSGLALIIPLHRYYRSCFPISPGVNKQNLWCCKLKNIRWTDVDNACFIFAQLSVCVWVSGHQVLQAAELLRNHLVQLIHSADEESEGKGGQSLLESSHRRLAQSTFTEHPQVPTSDCTITYRTRSSCMVTRG